MMHALMQVKKICRR